jgi:hypothetical protein
LSSTDIAPNWITATCTGAPAGGGGAAAATCVAGCGIQPGGGTNALSGSAERVDAAIGADGGADVATAWFGAGADATAWPGGIQPGGGANALLGSAERVAGTTGAGGGAVAWLGVGIIEGACAGAGAGAAAATPTAWPGGVQPAGGTNALLGSAGRDAGTTGAAGEAIA